MIFCDFQNFSEYVRARIFPPSSQPAVSYLWNKLHSKNVILTNLEPCYAEKAKKCKLYKFYVMPTHIIRHNFPLDKCPNRKAHICSTQNKEILNFVNSFGILQSQKWRKLTIVVIFCDTQTELPS